jgi:hypothetical protein
VLIDAGLLPDQRAFLQRECTIVDAALGPGVYGVFAKTSIHRFETGERTICILDSDAIVTSCLEPIAGRAEEGFVCGFVNNDTYRFFSEWAGIFGLRAPLRRRPFLNGSFLALSTERWRRLLERWEKLCGIIQERRSRQPFLLRWDEVLRDPVGFSEQDVLNALLMSEIPDDAIASWDHDLAPSWADRRAVSLLDERTLRCTHRGREPFYIEWTGAVKPWMPWGWTRRRYDAFVRLFPRVTLPADVPLRLSPSELPVWLRGTVASRAAYSLLNAGAGAAHGALGLVPGSLRGRVTHGVRTALAGKRPARRSEG